MNLIGQGKLEQGFDFKVFHGAALHGAEVVFFVHSVPVHDPLQFFFEDHIQPDAGGAAIAFTKGVGHIHFHVFLDDLFKRHLRLQSRPRSCQCLRVAG